MLCYPASLSVVALQHRQSLSNGRWRRTRATEGERSQGRRLCRIPGLIVDVGIQTET